MTGNNSYFDEGGLSADETAYFSSKGADTEAFERAYGSGATAKPEGGQREQQTETPASDALKGAETPSEEHDDDDDDAGHQNGTVPHGRFHKERERRRAAEARERDQAIKFARAEERLNILNEMISQGIVKQPEGQQPPANGQQPAKKSALEEADINPDEDIIGAFHQNQRRLKEMMELMKGNEVKAEKTEHQQREAGFGQAYRNDALAFKEKTPDFGNAYAYLVGNYAAELRLNGMTDEAQIKATIVEAEKDLVRNTIGQGKSPSELIYALAKQRGYRVQEQQTPEETPAPEPGAEVRDKIKTIQRGQKTTPTLTNSGGGAEKPLTMASLVDMDDDEFARRTKGMSKEQRYRTFGQ